jgi:DNA-directed RNA polymerase subunit beta'
MPYIAIPSNLKNVSSISLSLMSSQEMQEMSFGEVLTSETINYRTGLPQKDGLFCQAIFGPVKDWECACGKYKRYRYSGVVCDKCGVEVTHSSVRRERMGHVTLASPCVHPWFLRVIPSKIATILDMKVADLSKIIYFSAYVVIDVKEEVRQEYLIRIDKESESRIKDVKAEFETEVDAITKDFQKSKNNPDFDYDLFKARYDAQKEILTAKRDEQITKIQSITELTKQNITDLKYKDVINEVTYQELASKFSSVFTAGIGAEAIQKLLRDMDLEEESKAIAQKILETKGQTKKKLATRLSLIRKFINNGTKPEWMILNSLMVIPPDLRPMLQLDGGRFAASDLNELYRRLINRNNRLRKLIQISAPEVILRNEKRMLQEAVEALIDNSARGGKQVMASTGIKRALKSLTDVLKGKNGRFRQNLLGKRVDYSGRSVIIVGPSLNLDQCGLPKQIALELFKPFMVGRIINKSEQGLIAEEFQCFNVHSARRLIDEKKPIVYDILDEVIKDKYVLLNRAPTLHKLSFMAFKPILVEGKAIQIHPLVCKAFNADFDGDQMAVHLPITLKGQEEARKLMLSTKNLLKPASGEIIMSGGSLDIILGSYYLTMDLATESKDLKVAKNLKHFSSTSEAILALENGVITLHQKIKVRIKKSGETTIVETTAGRIVFNQPFPEEFRFINEPLNKKAYEKVINDAYFQLGADKLPKILDAVKNLAFKWVTISGASLSAKDFIIPEGKVEVINGSKDKVTKVQEAFELGMTTQEERYNQIIQVWRDASDTVAKMTEKAMDETNNVGLMIKSGARGNTSQLNLIAGIRGLSMTASGHTIELPALNGYIEGLTGLEYFISMKGQRKGQSDISLRTADAGYLTRRLVDVAQNLVIQWEDCGSKDGIVLREGVNRQGSLFEPNSRLYGRYLVEDVLDSKGKVVASAGDYVEHKLLKVLKEAGSMTFHVRTPMKCLLPKGICKKCYGVDFSTHKPIELGVPVGVIAAQSLGENSTQLTMDQGKHKKGLIEVDITEGLGRVEEIFEARTPKFKVPFFTSDLVVQEVEGSLDEGFSITLQNKVLDTRMSFDLSVDTVVVDDKQSVSAMDVIMYKDTGEPIITGISGVITRSENQIVISQASPETFTINTEPNHYLKVKKGDIITKGTPITEGSLSIQEIMDKLGFDAVQDYVINQIVGIYSENGIVVNEKHIEVIIRQMCSRVIIIEPNDSDYIVGDSVRYRLIKDQNQKLVAEGKKPAIFSRLVTGISRASLITDSFLSAASFQEASKVLTEAVISSRPDRLSGLKENVILGQLIPAGTGFKPNNDYDNDDYELELINESILEETEI